MRSHHNVGREHTPKTQTNCNHKLVEHNLLFCFVSGVFLLMETMFYRGINPEKAKNKLPLFLKPKQEMYKPKWQVTFAFSFLFLAELKCPVIVSWKYFERPLESSPKTRHSQTFHCVSKYWSHSVKSLKKNRRTKRHWVQGRAEYGIRG